MSENIIYCYSGSGHCLNMARSIARVLGDTDIVMMRSFPAKTDATEARRVGFVFPCYGGGLRFHGMSTILSQLYHDGYMEARAVEQTSVFEAAEQFARTEGILPAPESSHAIKAAIDEALKCRETGEEKTILFGLTGTGYFDLVAYQQFNDGLRTDYIPTDEDLAKGLAALPQVPGQD